MNRSPAACPQGSLFLAVLRQGVPLALGMAGHALFNLVDLLLVGRLGESVVAGVHVATTINFVPMILGNGISIATMSMMARLVGAGRRAEARRLSSRAQVLMLYLGLIVGAIGGVLAPACVDLQGVQGEARQVGVHYLLVMQLGTVTMYGLMQTTTTMRAVGEGMMPALLLIGANVLNLVLDLILIFGWPALSIPAFGAPGAAYASVVSRGVAAGVGLWWIGRAGYVLRFSWAAQRGPRGQRREILWLGLPQSLQMFVRALAVIALTRVAAELGGQDAVVALGVTTRLDTLVLFAAAGFGSASTSLVGRSCGAGEPLRARAASRWGGLLSLAFGAVLVLVFAALARPLIALFVMDVGEPTLRAGEQYLRLAALGHPFAAFAIAVTGGVNGSGRFIPPMLLDAVGYFGLVLPGVIVAAALSSRNTLVHVWWTYAATNVVLALAYWLYLERGAWVGTSCQTGSTRASAG